MDWDLDKGEILKTYKNDIEWLKTIFFHEKRHTRSFLKSFKWFKAILTSYHVSHQTSPQTKSWMGLRQGWNSENLQKWVWMAQNDIFHERRHTRSFLQVSSDLKPFWQVTIFHTRLPTNQIMDWDLDKGEILKTYKNEFEWLKTIFFMKEGIRDHFCKVSSDLKPFLQVTIFHTRLPHKPNHGLGFRQGQILKLTKMGLTGLKRFFSWKKGIRDHFCKVSSDLKPFWQVTIFHTRLPHKPNHGLGLRQGWNSETYKMSLNGSKRFFSWKKAYSIILKSFKWFKAIWQVTMFHTRLPHKPNHGLGLRQGWNSENLQKWVWMAQKDIFHEEGIRDHFAKFQVI